MCSYQNISETNFGNCLSENWEENMWANVLSPSSDTSTSYSQVSDSAVDAVSGINVIKTSQDYQTNISSTIRSAESSAISSTWTGLTSSLQTCTNMSTYFSTFNPTSQFQESPVRHVTNVKSQTTTGNWNRPQARINLVPSENGNFKAIVKRKRKRTVFTTEQIQVLEEVYSKKPYVNRDERQLLVQQLQVNDKSVKIWFQNRRLKNKRGDDLQREDNNQCSIFDRIDIVESKLKERTNEFGYVTLDDKIVNELVNVIDDYFTNNVSPVEINTKIDNSPIYEPISPASTSDNSCEENGSDWQYYNPSDIVQELIDIESIITT